jgi:hypothetical protein
MPTVAKPLLSRLVIPSAVVVYAIFIWRTAFKIDGKVYFTLFDDAMISMTYARNLAAGWGLRWNPGEPAVEGYTNFLWTLWMALVHEFVPESKAGLVVMLTSMACLVANVFVVMKIASKVSDGSRIAVTGSAVLTAFSFSLMYWSLRGMEVGFLTLVLSVGLYLAVLLLERFAWATFRLLLAVLSVALLTRPDSGLPVGIIVGAVWFAAERRLKLRIGALGLVVLGGVLAAHMAFRYTYYHDLFPNTYYLKVTGTPLGTRVREGVRPFLRIVAFDLWPVLVLVATATSKLWRAIPPEASAAVRCRTLRLRLLTVLLAGQCAYSIYVGGDAWEELRFANRYIAIVLPAGYIVSTYLLGDAFTSDSRSDVLAVSWGLVVGASAALCFVVAYRFDWSLRAYFGYDQYQMGGRRFIVYALGDCGMLAIGLALLLAPRLGWERMLRSGVLSATVILVLLVTTSGTALASWTVENAPYLDTDWQMARLGILLRGATSDGAHLGVVWAGTPSYFSHRNAVDLLGKNDPVIARMAPRGPFRPGHNKWNLRYSIDTYHPDLLIQTWRLNDADRAYLGREGYERLPNGIYLRTDSRKVDAQKARDIPFPMRNMLEEPSASGSVATRP